MSSQGLPVHLLKLAVALAAIFNLLALVVMVHTTPLAFTLFMFLGQPLFVLALVLLVSAVLADLRARQII